jgi:hypothetical protein
MRMDTTRIRKRQPPAPLAVALRVKELTAVDDEHNAGWAEQSCWATAGIEDPAELDTWPGVEDLA